MFCRGKDEARIVTTNCEKSAEAIVLERGRAKQFRKSNKMYVQSGSLTEATSET